MAINLSDMTFKKLNTVGDLRKLLNKITKSSNITDKTPIKMFSDEEGNAVNKILCADFDGENILLIPWEEFDF
jgi:hypothetical protein